MNKPISAIILCALALSTITQAEEPWRFQVTPYLWGPGLSGDIRLTERLPKVEIDRSLDDILDDLDAAFFLSGTARHEGFVVLADFTWAKLSENDSIGVPATPNTPPLNVPLGLNVELMAATAAVGYSLVERPDFVVDVLGGVRYWGVDTSLKLKHHIPALPSKFEDDESWTDPILIARGRIRLSANWSAILYADIGGFGAGSDLTWQGLGTFNYEMNDAFYLSLGYRYLALDYSDGGLKLDLGMGGPLAGLTYRF